MIPHLHSFSSNKDFLYEVLNNCNTIDDFCHNLNRASEKTHDFLFMTKSKGCSFELLCQMIINLSTIDERIGITNYRPITENDCGVDGIGMDREGHPVAVQCKYRKFDEIGFIENWHLANFAQTARLKHNVDLTKPGRLIIMTTGKELSYKVINETNRIYRCISRSSSYGCVRGSKNTNSELFSLKTIVDRNKTFWDFFKAQVL